MFNHVCLTKEDAEALHEKGILRIIGLALIDCSDCKNLCEGILGEPLYPN